MNEFIEKIYEIAFGDDAINKGYSQDDVVNQLYAQSQELINYIKRNETVVFTECENPKTQQVNVSLTLEASTCLLYTSPSPRDQRGSRMPSSA